MTETCAATKNESRARTLGNCLFLACFTFRSLSSSTNDLSPRTPRTCAGALRGGAGLLEAQACFFAARRLYVGDRATPGSVWGCSPCLTCVCVWLVELIGQGRQAGWVFRKTKSFLPSRKLPSVVAGAWRLVRSLEGYGDESSLSYEQQIIYPFLAAQRNLRQKQVRCFCALLRDAPCLGNIQCFSLTVVLSGGDGMPTNGAG